MFITRETATERLEALTVEFTDLMGELRNYNNKEDILQSYKLLLQIKDLLTNCLPKH